MSVAGIQSNRGDGYQTLVALDWALTVLTNPEYQWLEIDSVGWLVDDVVIGKADGNTICCQCKKNQPAQRAWSMSDLADELRKAGRVLADHPRTEVRFYSRSNFGDIDSLREYSINHADEASYSAGLGVKTRRTDVALGALLVGETPKLSTFDFLRRSTFEITSALDRMEAKLRERLGLFASNPLAAYNALWTRLDQLGMRVSGDDGRIEAAQHRLNKKDLNDLLHQAGSMLAPQLDVRELRASFHGTSAIGRAWRRDVGSERIPSPLIEELLTAIAAKHRAILLTGQPGAGKTCVMLALQDALEKHAQTHTDLLPLFIQAREFADLSSAQDRHAQGLPEQWVEKAARLAEDAHVVVLIDSLDVLSIAREHSSLKYFLAQIDRLLMVPNVTVVTACREFDRHYDRRIAERTWDQEFACKPLDWDKEVTPLLASLSIPTLSTDRTTRELICNPRELALFVELAQQSGSFNVVTSQALAQRYLQTLVQANTALGDAAMLALETIAAEMLRLRSLAVPHQRFSGSTDILRVFLSHNILHKAHNEKLTFGHQTLLDVLVISGAIRQGLTLNSFIQGLPPVPFVRPSIRSFVMRLASNDRSDFRRQMRTVLTSNSAFHIRRLVAECFAEQVPQIEDWPLMRDLRKQHLDVFQVIYAYGNHIEWHHFWLQHLVPLLKVERDDDGFTRHVHRTAQWLNEDPAGVLSLWTIALHSPNVDQGRLSESIARALTDVKDEHAALIAPLLQQLIKLPRQEHSFLGRALARCVSAGAIDDDALWRYVAGDVLDEDLRNYELEKNLYCLPHEFGGSKDNFLEARMRQSTHLLDLAVSSIERWSSIQHTYFGGPSTALRDGFLNLTSYEYEHSQADRLPAGSGHILFNAVGAAIQHYAKTDENWWRCNRDRLSASSEASLRYFAILACTATPLPNLSVIRRLLDDKTLLESSLSYEMGALLQASFFELDPDTQDSVQVTISEIHQQSFADSLERIWAIRQQAQLLVCIPRHLRSAAATTIIEECEKTFWPLVRTPRIGMRGGWVRAPFSFDVFLAASDTAVLRLLAHYNGYVRHSFDDFLLGGELQVGQQLSEAASRHPSRFSQLLTAHWSQIPPCFCDAILAGIATYLAHKHGNLQSNTGWFPIEEPNPQLLARKIFDELDNHAAYWHHSREASKALQACAHIVQSTQDASRLAFLAVSFSTKREKDAVSGTNVDHITNGINMARGHVVEALIETANQLHKNAATWPALLAPTLRQFAADDHPAIRAVLLRHLPYFQDIHPEAGWELFSLAMQRDASGLWNVAEPCLYYAYHKNFETVAPWLARLHREGRGSDLETWGRISALAALSKRHSFSFFLASIVDLESAEAWKGAASVWTHSANLRQHWDECLTGLEAGLRSTSASAAAVASKFSRIFRDIDPPTIVPTDLLKRYFDTYQNKTGAKEKQIYGFHAWLNATSIQDPTYALAALKMYLDFVGRIEPYVHDYEDQLTQLMTRLFAQAEEQEESDGGAMLQHVVTVQDALLAMGIHGIDSWLKAAERP